MAVFWPHIPPLPSAESLYALTLKSTTKNRRHAQFQTFAHDYDRPLAVTATLSKMWCFQFRRQKTYWHSIVSSSPLPFAVRSCQSSAIHDRFSCILTSYTLTDPRNIPCNIQRQTLSGNAVSALHMSIIMYIHGMHSCQHVTAVSIKHPNSQFLVLNLQVVKCHIFCLKIGWSIALEQCCFLHPQLTTNHEILK